VTDLLSLTASELTAYVVELGYPKFRAKQLLDWLNRGATFDEMSNLPRDFRARLAEVCELRTPLVEQKQVSQKDGTIKYLLRLIDGNCIESVLMRYKHGNTLCISSQVGCRMGCKFCASTIGGRVRDLAPSELLGQIIAVQKDTGERVSNVVMMGIGEPLDNYDNVIRFLRLVGSEDGLNIGYRHISLSTCGVVSGIERLAKEDLPITLSVSLHAANDETRSAIMPINQKWSIHALLTACVNYFATTGRRISFEYTLISGKNDSVEDAKELGKLLRRYFRKGEPVHVNLIRINEVAETGFKRGTNESAYAFQHALETCGVTATLRRRLGADIDAACGQLRKKHAEQNN
jgi:23S rRNA (adenine2503-C2)-methyltransferase